jgi:ABC-2 type transport system ATP-binding protein
MISVKELTKKYARNLAVDHIFFEVKKGEIVGFLGPNGAGKTTTMRMLTCFLLPTSGTATVAGFDVLEQPLEVKRRIGYLPETPPLYPEMIADEYLSFVGKLKGLSGAELRKRVDYVCDRCAIGDVKKKQLGKLSKGYRQRVGLAQAIIHNPDVLILDEPTAGLDPKQINETRDLIKSLAGDHTIILSTHILPEVEQTCEQVVIISKGKIVATDSVRNLRNRARAGESVVIEVVGRNGNLEAENVKQRLAQIAGVSSVTLKHHQDGRYTFEIDSEKNFVRGDLARTVVEAGWDLNELRAAAMSLEEIFLQLTGGEAGPVTEISPPAKGTAVNEPQLLPTEDASS